MCCELFQILTIMNLQDPFLSDQFLYCSTDVATQSDGQKTSLRWLQHSTTTYHSMTRYDKPELTKNETTGLINQKCGNYRPSSTTSGSSIDQLRLIHPKSVRDHLYVMNHVSQKAQQAPSLLGNDSTITRFHTFTSPISRLTYLLTPPHRISTQKYSSTAHSALALFTHGPSSIILHINPHPTY